MAILEWRLPGGAVRINRPPAGAAAGGEHCFRRPDVPVVLLLL